MTDDLVQFLRARLDEDEQAAQAAALHAAVEISTVARKADVHSPPYSGATWINDYDHVFVTDGRPGQPRKVMIADCGNGAFGLTPHIARHDPARVLAEVDAKRRILDDVLPTMQADELRIGGEWGVGADPVREASDDLLSLLALPYSDHPDFRPEWAPGQV